MHFKAGSFQVSAWVIIFQLVMTVLARHKILCLATGLYYQAQAPQLCTTTEVTSNPAWFWTFNTPTSKFKRSASTFLSFLLLQSCETILYRHTIPFLIQILFASFIPLSVTFPLLISLLWLSKDWPAHTRVTVMYKNPSFQPLCN